MTQPRWPHRLDVMRAIRRAAAAFGQDFAAIVIGGFVAVVLPAVLFAPAGTSTDASTVTTTLRFVLAMLYAAMVSHGVVARCAGQPLPPWRFVIDGLAMARPGLIVALLLGAAIVGLMIVELAGREGTLAGTALHALVAAAVIWAACILLPVVPVAVVERLGPLTAIRRAADLTRGSRDRILALLVVVALTLAPAALLIASLVEHDGSALGIWLTALFDLLAAGLLATVPAVVYAGLTEGAEPAVPR